MDKRDVKHYLKAKKQTLISDITFVLGALCVLAIMILEGMKIEHNYTLALSLFSFNFMLLAYGGNYLINVSRQELINIIGRAITRDPQALKHVAAVQKSKETSD